METNDIRILMMIHEEVPLPFMGGTVAEKLESYGLVEKKSNIGPGIAFQCTEKGKEAVTAMLSTLIEFSQ